MGDVIDLTGDDSLSQPIFEDSELDKSEDFISLQSNSSSFQNDCFQNDDIFIDQQIEFRNNELNNENKDEHFFSELFQNNEQDVLTDNSQNNNQDSSTEKKKRRQEKKKEEQQCQEQKKSAQKELAKIEAQLQDIKVNISALERKERAAEKKKEQLLKDIEAQDYKIQSLNCSDWSEKFSWSEGVEEYRTNLFGIESFRMQQEEIINATLSKRDCFVIMPTGGGKSLCYQLPAVMDVGLTIVISPLLSLIADQVMWLNQLGIPAASLSSKNTRNQSNKVMEDVDSGRLRLLYLTPEKIAGGSKNFLFSRLEKLNSQNKFSRIVIDEAHCCSTWGHDFRPDYRKLGVLKHQFPKVPIIALTATATYQIQEDVKQTLGIQGCELFKSSFNRPNLFYEVRKKPTSAKTAIIEISKVIQEKFPNDSGIIYTFSQKDTETVAQGLMGLGVSASAYHAAMSNSDRETVHDSWLRNKIKVVVATIAFGLGINKPDVRFVIHHSISKSLEAFYQESGRAGRDGKPATCIVYFKYGDLTRNSTMVMQAGIEKLYDMVRFCDNITECRRVMMARFFHEDFTPEMCDDHCDICVRDKATKIVQKDITNYAKDIVTILEQGKLSKDSYTIPQLIDAWNGKVKTVDKQIFLVDSFYLPLKSFLISTKGAKQIIGSQITAPSELSNHDCTRIVCHLLLENYLEEYFKHTAFSTNSYIRLTKNAGGLKHGLQVFIDHLEEPKKKSLKRKNPEPKQKNVKKSTTEKVSTKKKKSNLNSSEKEFQTFLYKKFKQHKISLTKADVEELMNKKPENLHQLNGCLPEKKIKKFGKQIITLVLSENLWESKNDTNSNIKQPELQFTSKIPEKKVKSLKSKSSKQPIKKRRLTKKKTARLTFVEDEDADLDGFVVPNNVVDDIIIPDSQIVKIVDDDISVSESLSEELF